MRAPHLSVKEKCFFFIETRQEVFTPRPETRPSDGFARENEVDGFSTDLAKDFEKDPTTNRRPGDNLVKLFTVVIYKY